MPLKYSTETKNDRMKATRDGVAGGTLEIGTNGMETVLAKFKLSENGGKVIEDYWELAFAADSVLGLPAAGNGERAVSAQIRNRSGQVRIHGLTVGAKNADIILTNTSIAHGQDVIIADACIQHA